MQCIDIRALSCNVGKAYNNLIKHKKKHDMSPLKASL